MKLPSNEQTAAAAALVAGARGINKSLGTFTGWLAAGVGAGFALLAGNVDKLSNVVSFSHVRVALWALIASLVTAVVSKLLTAISSAQADSMKAGEKIGKRLGEQGIAIDIEAFEAELLKGLFWPHRLMLRRTLALVKAGDLNIGARVIAKLAQIVQYLVLAFVLFVVVAAVSLVTGMRPEPTAAISPNLPQQSAK